MPSVYNTVLRRLLKPWASRLTYCNCLFAVLISVSRFCLKICLRIREGEGVEAIHCAESDISRVLELTCPFLPDSSLVSMELSFFFPLILP